MNYVAGEYVSLDPTVICREPATTELIGPTCAHPARVLFIVLPERRSTGLRLAVGGDQRLHTREPRIIGCWRVAARPSYCAPHRSFGGAYPPQPTSSSSSLRKTRDPSSRAIAQRRGRAQSRPTAPVSATTSL